MKSLIRFFYKQTLFGNLLTFIVLLVGVVTLFIIRKDLFPNVSFDMTTVTVVMPGASPEQIEKLVINPIEQAIHEVDGVKKVQSNAVDNRASVVITLDPDARKIDKTNQDIQRAIDRMEDLPAEADKPIVTVLESAQSPVIEVSLYSESLSETQLRAHARKVADELSLLPGVARVIKQAWQKQEWIVEVSQKKLRDNHISLSQVIQALKSQNIQSPSGDMILEDNKEVSLRVDGEYKNPDEILKTYLRSNFDGYGVQVKDVARVYEKLEDPTIIYRTNGTPSFSMVITKKEKADALKVVNVVRSRMEELKKDFPQDVDFRFVNDFTQYLKNRISILSGNMMVGILLVLIVLAFFLPFRVALVVALGIPFSMLGGVFLLYKLGFSINLISLIGLIIVSGMLVDDAIVVVENVYRRFSNGDPLEEAIVEGTAEMVPAVTASVLTTIAAFSPMMFMSGIFGKFIFEIPVMVIVPLLISLMEAFLVAPGHFKDIVGHWLNRSKTKGLFDQTNDSKVHWYDRILPYYRNIIFWTVRNKLVTISIFIIFLGITGVVAKNMKFMLFPPDGIYSFFIRVDGPVGASFEDMIKLVEQVEPYLKEIPKEELADFVTQIGIQQNDPNDPLTKRAKHYAQLRVNLTPENKRTRRVSEVVEDLRKKIPLPTGALRIQFEMVKGGPPQGRPVSVNILGEDFKIIRQMADDLKKELSQIQGVTDIEDSEMIGKKEIRVIPDEFKLSQVGLSTADISQTLRASFAGVVATTTRTLDEEINLRVKLEPKKLDTDKQLAQVLVGAKNGGLIPLDKLTQRDEAPSRLVVQHEKFKRLINVSAQVDLLTSTAAKANAELKTRIDGISKKYPEYKISFGGEDEDARESMAGLFASFGFAAIMILSILILTFGNLIQPLIVMAAIPLGLAGTIWALFLHGRPISFLAVVGMVALAGVIVNNAIVYIDFFNSLRKEGKSVETSLVDAASTRLRPIILTSLTTVLGLFPTAYGIGGADGFVMGLALSIGWGLAIGSVLTVLFFPALLGFIERVRGHV